MSLDPLASHRTVYCHQCTKKPAQQPYVIKTVDKRIIFCSIKCIQSYKYQEAKKIKDVKAVEVKNC